MRNLVMATAAISIILSASAPGLAETETPSATANRAAEIATEDAATPALVTDDRVPAVAMPTSRPDIEAQTTASIDPEDDPGLALPPGPSAVLPAAAVESPVKTNRPPPTANQICNVIADNADRVKMDRDFFARLIWKESRFDVKAVSPVGARGIAQFMPYTAEERGLADPYDYEEAIRHSALYLRDLRNELGNWGLAAAAYNGGINRMKGWLSRGASGALPYETVEYVNAITFRPIEWFVEDGRDVEPRPLDGDRAFMESCARLPIMKTRAVFAALGATGGTNSAPMRPWGAQVAGHPKRETAEMIFGRLAKKFPSIFGSRQPIVMRAKNNAGNPIYAVRMGTETRGEAESFCERFRGMGGFCTVMKNR